MNRRQRRAQATPSSKPSSVTSVSDIPYSHPPTNTTASKPAKTLLEIAAEKQSQLQSNTKKFTFDPSSNSNVVNVKIDEKGNLISPSSSSIRSSPSSTTTPRQARTAAGEAPSPSTDDDDGDAALPPWIDTLLLTTTMSLLHFTLSVLTAHQYAMSIEFPPLIKSTLLTAFPTLFLTIHLFHGHLLPLPFLSPSHPSSSPTPRTLNSLLTLYNLRSLCYVSIANVSGCYLITLTNDKGYYAVMKNAPSIGTLWVWSVLEMGLVGALAGVVGPGLWAAWWGYGLW